MRVCGSGATFRRHLAGRIDGLVRDPTGKGEEIREMRIGSIYDALNSLVWAKGEVFQESFGALVIAKVRKYRIKTVKMTRKSPTDAVGAVRVGWRVDLNGEVFRDLCDRNGKPRT